MKNLVIFATAAMFIGGVVGCSSDPTPASSKGGELTPGTAKLTVSGNEAATVKAVHCWTIESSTMITTGTDTSGATAMVSNAQKPVVEFVQVRNVDGFTGDYNLGLGGDARVTMTGRTYEIAGTAKVYGPTSVQRTTEPFALKVSC